MAVILAIVYDNLFIQHMNMYSAGVHIYIFYTVMTIKYYMHVYRGISTSGAFIFPNAFVFTWSHVFKHSHHCMFQ